MDRARLVVTDIIYILLALAALAALWPVLNDLLITITAPRLAPREELIFTSMLPLSIMVLLAVIYIEARSGLR